jgi:hypothetical protein
MGSFPFLLETEIKYRPLALKRQYQAFAGQTVSRPALKPGSSPKELVICQERNEHIAR